MDELFLAIDIGTSNIKVAAVDPRGKPIAEVEQTYPTHHPRPGWAEQNPQDWIVAITSALKSLSLELKNKQKYLIGCALSGHGPTLVLVDAQGEPMQLAPTWQDSRSLPQGELLLKDLASHEWLGMGPLRTGMAAKLLWAKQNWPNTFNECRWVMGVKEYVYYWLTGNVASEPSSGPGSMEWPYEVFEYIGLPQYKLPEVFSITHKSGVLRPEVSKATGLPSGIPVYMGLNDGASSTLGTGACNAGNACISLGTNGVARLVLDRPFDPMEGLKINAFFWPFIPGRWVAGGMTITGGSSLGWIKNCIGSLSFQELAKEAEQAPAGSRGIIFLPYLMGRGTPFPLENARAAFINLDIAHTRGEVVRAVMEGVGFALREIFAEFELRGFELGDVRITGGGARVDLWRQIMAGILNRRIVHAGGDATLGAAIIVATASGMYPDFPSAVDRMVHIREINEPNAEHAAAYQQTYEEFLSLSLKLGFRQDLQR